MTQQRRCPLFPGSETASRRRCCNSRSASFSGSMAAWLAPIMPPDISLMLLALARKAEGASVRYTCCRRPPFRRASPVL